MKVAIINRHRQDALGGSEIQCDIIARSMLERGNDIVYIAADGRGKYPGVPYKICAVPLAARDLTIACLSEQPSIIYWRLNKNYFRHVARTMHARHIPLVFAASHLNDLMPWRVKPSSEHNILGDLRRMLRERWNYSGYRWVKGIVCQTPEQSKMAPLSRTTVIFNSGWPSNPRPFSWPRPYVVWVSNIKRAKRPELCVALASHLLTQGIDVVMIGRMIDEGYSWLEGGAPGPQNLHYIGPRTLEEVDGVLAGARALVHTCMPEGFPNVFIQAWLQGIPTVSLEFDPAGIIKSHRLGYVSAGDVQQFHKDVLQIATDSEIACQAGNRARVFAHEYCVPGRNAARLEAFLAEVIEADDG